MDTNEPCPALTDLELATTEELIAELGSRSTFAGVIVMLEGEAKCSPGQMIHSRQVSILWRNMTKMQAVANLHMAMNTLIQQEG